MLAARGEWVTNEKALLTQAGLAEIDRFAALAGPDPDLLSAVVGRARAFCSAAVHAAAG